MVAENNDNDDVLESNHVTAAESFVAELELLSAAGAESAKSIVITSNDPEDAMRIVHLCQQYFPHLAVFARAGGRFEAHELLPAGGVIHY